MGLWKRKSVPADRISSEALADFGRFDFLGEQSGIDPMNAFGLVSNLNELIYTSDAADRATLIAELRRHAERGEWEKVGAWKYVRNFLSEEPEAQELIDGGLLAISRMRVTNLDYHLAPIDVPRYVELSGEQPPSDGFFGPPVFDSSYGPTKQYYFDSAITAAAARRIDRVPSAPGVEPGPVDGAARAMWDFGLLIYRGPLVINPDIRFEPNVVRPATTAASNVDHRAFMEKLAEAVLDETAPTWGAWSVIGAARFAEDYLDPTALDTPAYSRVLRRGIEIVAPVLGRLLPEQLLSTRQRQCLHEMSADGQ